MKSRFFGLAIAAGLTLLSAQKAIAHGVEVQYQSRQSFEVSAAYDTGEPMANAQVLIFSPADSATPWQTAKTDAQGRFTFVPSEAGNWQIKIQQAGHGAALTIPVAEAAASQPAASISTASADQPAHADSTPAEQSPAEQSPAVPMTAATASPLQKGVMIGSVIWGCIGTALFFSRSSKRQQPQN